MTVLYSACSSNPPVAPGSFAAPTPVPCTGVFGDTTIESSSAPGPNQVVANKFSFSGGTVYQFGVYSSGAGQFRGAIYADGGSAPSTLIAQSAAVSTVASAGWNYAPLTVNLPSGNYWLALQADSNVSPYYTFNGTTSLPYLTQSFGAFPSSYSGYTACSCSIISMVVDFCPFN